MRAPRDARVSRVAAMALEPRGVLARVAEDGRLHIAARYQNPYQLRDKLAAVLGLDRDAVRVTLPDIGGFFGMKSGAYPEYVLAAWVTRRLGRPVRWIAGRSESFLSDCHGRDVEVIAALGLDEYGHFTGLHVQYLMNVGAYLSERGLPALNNIGGVAGVYRTPVIVAEARHFFYLADGSLSRCRPTRGNVHDRAPHRHRGPGHRSVAV
ncbi:molybdopterin-dependent oxidoreductase [Marinivivus vitaminiproducens]|nr:molybdopterin-dependent oxidoreductase [Geminicoccaceae bacterium SCSIO 64248]